jgi:hypothetical protein
MSKRKLSPIEKAIATGRPFILLPQQWDGTPTKNAQQPPADACDGKTQERGAKPDD